MTFCVIHLVCPLNREIQGQINIGLFVTKNLNFGRDVWMVSARVFVFSHVVYSLSARIIVLLYCLEKMHVSRISDFFLKDTNCVKCWVNWNNPSLVILGSIHISHHILQRGYLCWLLMSTRKPLLCNRVVEKNSVVFVARRNAGGDIETPVYITLHFVDGTPQKPPNRFVHIL